MRWDNRGAHHGERSPRDGALALGAADRRSAWFRRYAALWLVLLVLSTAVVLAESIPVAGPSPPLAASVAAVAGVVGLVLLHLGVVRFLAFGRTLDLFVGIAFGVLALANLAVRLATLALAPDAMWVAAPLLLLLLRALSALFLLVPLIRPGSAIERGRRVPYALRVGGATALFALLGAAGLIALGDALPAPVEPATRRLLEADAVVLDLLPGQAWWLLLANGVLSLLMIVATLRYIWWAGNAAEPYLGAVAMALTLLSFAQLHTLLFPTVVLDYISTAALFRLSAYVVVVVSLTAQVGRDMVERAGDEERTRLAREVHDGLMQHLSLLNLRLQRARSPPRSLGERARDLDAGVQVLEAAMLEARHIIIAQRSDVVDWESFATAVRTFAGVFETNHEVTIHVEFGASGPTVDASLLADILRIVHEACSNAVRHGAAGRIDVRLAADADRLDLRIRDDGTGFDPARAGGGSGFGLQSMRERTARWGGTCSIESAPGRGTVIHARLSLAPRRGMGT
jgi:signal transduction histidine kinase